MLTAKNRIPSQSISNNGVIRERSPLALFFAGFGKSGLSFQTTTTNQAIARGAWPMKDLLSINNERVPPGLRHHQHCSRVSFKVLAYCSILEAENEEENFLS